MTLAKVLVNSSLVLVSILYATMAWADPVLTIYPDGASGFNLRGEHLDEVSSMEITIDYDAAELEQPRVNRGSGLGLAQFDANTGGSGTITISIKSPRPLKGFVMVAVIAFTPKGDNAGTICAMQAVLTDKNGSIQPAQTNIINPTGKLNEQKGRNRVRAPSAIASPAPAHEPFLTSEPADTIQPQTASRREALTAEKPTFIRSEGVLDRFRGYTGPRSPRDLRALFTTAAEGFSQKPAVVLSDGITTITITVKQTGERSKTPYFLLRGAHNVSLHTKTGAWVLEVLPERGTHEASLTVLGNTEIREYPLTVAPPVQQLADDKNMPPWLRDFITTANTLAADATQFPYQKH